MEFKIERAVLAKRKLFLGLPMYGGVCHGHFARSLSSLSVECSRLGIELKTYMLFNESLITRARNYCVDEFLRSDATHLMFIDSDIGFDPMDVIALLALSGPETEYDVIGGAYPKKNISWEKIKAAVDKGVADKNPNELENYVGDYVFNPILKKGEDTIIKIDEVSEVLEIGTGFMMIQRRAFEKYKAHYPDIHYLPDHARSENFDGSREIGMYFQAEIEPKSRRYLSEDYLFCQNLRNAGGKVFLCPWMKLTHTGTYTFGGSLHALATIGVNPTADPNLLSKK